VALAWSAPPEMAASSARLVRRGFQNPDKKNLIILESHPNMLGFYMILSHIHRMQNLIILESDPNRQGFYHTYIQNARNIGDDFYLESGF
jgi:hypothetical protein